MSSLHPGPRSVDHLSTQDEDLRQLVSLMRQLLNAQRETNRYLSVLAGDDLSREALYEEE